MITREHAVSLLAKYEKSLKEMQRIIDAKNAIVDFEKQEYGIDSRSKDQDWTIPIINIRLALQAIASGKKIFSPFFYPTTMWRLSQNYFLEKKKCINKVNNDPQKALHTFLIDLNSFAYIKGFFFMGKCNNEYEANKYIGWVKRSLLPDKQKTYLIKQLNFLRCQNTKSYARLEKNINNFLQEISSVKKNIIFRVGLHGELSMIFHDDIWRDAFIKCLGGRVRFSNNHSYFPNELWPKLNPNEPHTLYFQRRFEFLYFPDKRKREAYYELMKNCSFVFSDANDISLRFIFLYSHTFAPTQTLLDTYHQMLNMRVRYASHLFAQGLRTLNTHGFLKPFPRELTTKIVKEVIGSKETTVEDELTKTMNYSLTRRP